MSCKSKILLENGIYLEGLSLGYIGTTGGELCFNTGMTGYQEILTDPSYCGQIINNFPVAYETYGSLNEKKHNAILVCHALTVDQFVTG